MVASDKPTSVATRKICTLGRTDLAKILSRPGQVRIRYGTLGDRSCALAGLNCESFAHQPVLQRQSVWSEAETWASGRTESIFDVLRLSL